MAHEQGGSDDTVRPCQHNDWDDVRTRNGFKVLRCRICQGRWKLPSRSVPRCMAYLHDHCGEGVKCGLLHVRRKKSNIYERYDMFGDAVLEGVAPSIQRKAKRMHADGDGHAVHGSGSPGPPDGGGSSGSGADEGGGGTGGADADTDVDADTGGGGKNNSGRSCENASSTGRSSYAHSPYSWGGTAPPEFI
eukprot:TRINITY_DN2066_c1_g1_i10.p2 TRINITY_DN2066_c1_g1~~TRINITY_DN2066_c1_g1_i10.p2  ORF type:complete len:191 (+),score=59.42 TRINITY_DN2066_c1_g1_i10:186-758(+)